MNNDITIEMTISLDIMSWMPLTDVKKVHYQNFTFVPSCIMITITCLGLRKNYFSSDFDVIHVNGQALIVFAYCKWLDGGKAWEQG